MPPCQIEIVKDSFQNISSLGTLVLHLHQMYLLEDTITGLARRHVDYSVRPEHFPPVWHALIHALDRHSLNGLTPLEMDVWAAANGEITDLMIEAMTIYAA